jgi:hypothetical protein
VGTGGISPQPGRVGAFAPCELCFCLAIAYACFRAAPSGRRPLACIICIGGEPGPFCQCGLDHLLSAALRAVACGSDCRDSASPPACCLRGGDQRLLSAAAAVTTARCCVFTGVALFVFLSDSVPVSPLQRLAARLFFSAPLANRLSLAHFLDLVGTALTQHLLSLGCCEHASCATHLMLCCGQQ